MSFVIAISGPIGSGKTTVSDELQKILSEHVNVITIPLAEDVYRCSDLMYNYLNIPIKKHRLLLQTIGDIGREQDVQFWVNRVIEKFEQFKNSCNEKTKVLIVPDVRYPIEVETLRRTYKVLHVKLNGSYREEFTTHSSETAMRDYDKYDLIIEAGSDIKEIVSTVITMVSIDILSEVDEVNTILALLDNVSKKRVRRRYHETTSF